MKLLVLVNAMLICFSASAQNTFIDPITPIAESTVYYTQEDSTVRLAVLLNVVSDDSTFDHGAIALPSMSVMWNVFYTDDSSKLQKSPPQTTVLQSAGSANPFLLYADLKTGFEWLNEQLPDSANWGKLSYRIQYKQNDKLKYTPRKELIPNQLKVKPSITQLHLPNRGVKLEKHKGFIKVTSTPYGLPFKVTSVEILTVKGGDRYSHKLEKDCISGTMGLNGMSELFFTTEFELATNGESLYWLTVKGHQIGDETQTLQSNTVKVEFVSSSNFPMAIANRPSNYVLTFPADEDEFIDRDIQTWRNDINLGIYFFEDTYRQLEVTVIPKGDGLFDIHFKGLKRLPKGSSSVYYYVERNEAGKAKRISPYLKIKKK